MCQLSVVHELLDQMEKLTEYLGWDVAVSDVMLEVDRLEHSWSLCFSSSPVVAQLDKTKRSTCLTRHTAYGQCHQMVNWTTLHNRCPYFLLQVTHAVYHDLLLQSPSPELVAYLSQTACRPPCTFVARCSVTLCCAGRQKCRRD